MKNVFLSGLGKAPNPMQKFERYGKILNEMGHKAVYYNFYNQLWAAGLQEMPWEMQMRAVIGVLMQCDELHLMQGWEDDREAKLLREIWMRLNFTIVYH